MFDYGTPEFITGWNGLSYVQVNVPFTSDMAFATRYWDPDNDLFDIDSPQDRFLFSDDSASAILDGNRYSNPDGRLTVSRELRLPGDISDEMREFFSDRISLDVDPIVSELRPVYRRMVAQYGADDIYISDTASLNVTRFGDYYCESIYRYKSIGHSNKDENGDWLDWSYETDDTDNERHIYRIGSTEPLEMEDIFKDGVDIREVLTRAIAGEISERMSWRYNEGEQYPFMAGEYAELDEKYARAIAENVNVCGLSYDSLLIDDLSSDDLRPIYEYAYGEVAPLLEDYGLWDSWYGSISFKNIGPENLTLFDTPKEK